MLNVLKREWYVVRYGQTARFRLIKWVIIFALIYLLQNNFGWLAVKWFVGLGFIIGVGGHFYLRYKTQGWTKEWKFAKVVRTPYE